SANVMAPSCQTGGSIATRTTSGAPATLSRTPCVHHNAIAVAPPVIAHGHAARRIARQYMASGEGQGARGQRDERGERGILGRRRARVGGERTPQTLAPLFG